MPLYEYECDACGQRFELIRKFSDPPVAVCSICGSGPVRRLLSSPAIQFKGSGWYITDYAGKGKGEKSEKPSGDKPSDPTSGAAAKEGTAKTETRTDSAEKPAASPRKETKST